MLAYRTITFCHIFLQIKKLQIKFSLFDLNGLSGSESRTTYALLTLQLSLPRKFAAFTVQLSSVARGGGATAPPVGLSTKTQNKKNTTFLALLKLFFFFALEWTKIDLKQRLKHIFRGGGGRICQKLKSQINKNFKKLPKNKP